MIGNKLYDMMKQITEGTYDNVGWKPEYADELLEQLKILVNQAKDKGMPDDAILHVISVLNTDIEKGAGEAISENDGLNDQKFEMSQKFASLVSDFVDENKLELEKLSYKDVYGVLEEGLEFGLNHAEIDWEEHDSLLPPVQEDIAAPADAGEGAPTEDTLESVLKEKDDKKKDDEWKDERSHDEAVKAIVRDSWKEIFVDGKFKGDKEPTREEVMTEVEFQSKHGLDHRPDASAIKYDAFKKVMKKVKNIQKKLDAESDETPEEEDTEVKTKFETKPFIGMTT